LRLRVTPALFVAAVPVSCAGGPPEPGRTYRIGFGGDKPLHYVGPDGQATGLAVTLVREAARRRGIRLEWIPARLALSDQQDGRLDLFVLLADLRESHREIYLSRPCLATESAFPVMQPLTPDSLLLKVEQVLRGECKRAG
jgi:hypothetical protein